MSEGSSAALINLTQELLFTRESDFLLKKQRPSMRRKSKQEESFKKEDKKINKVMPPPTEEQLVLTGEESEREAYLKIYLQTKKQRDRFQPY